MIADLCGICILLNLFVQDAKIIFGRLHWFMGTLSKYVLIFTLYQVLHIGY